MITENQSSKFTSIFKVMENLTSKIKKDYMADFTFQKTFGYTRTQPLYLYLK